MQSILLGELPDRDETDLHLVDWQQQTQHGRQTRAVVLWLLVQYKAVTESVQDGSCAWNGLRSVFWQNAPVLPVRVAEDAWQHCGTGAVH